MADGPERMEPLREELQHVVDCVRSRRAPRADGANGLRVPDACQRSLEADGRAMEV